MTCAEWWRATRSATRARGTSAGAVLVLVLVGLSATSRSVLAEPSMPSEPVAFASKSHLLHHASVQLGRSGVEAGYAPGFGKEDLWFGLDTRASVRVDHAGGWFGLRLHSDVVEIRTSALFAYSFRRSFLPLRDSYRRQDAELRLDEARQPVALAQAGRLHAERLEVVAHDLVQDAAAGIAPRVSAATPIQTVNVAVTRNGQSLSRMTFAFPPTTDCQRLVTKEGTTRSAIAVGRSSATVSSPRLTIGRPRPITPFTAPATKKAPLTTSTVVKSNKAPLLATLHRVLIHPLDTDCAHGVGFQISRRAEI